MPPRVLESISEMMQGEGEMYTPYGATESLPIASIESREVLGETAAKCNAGAGTCVGNRFSGIERKVIAIVAGPLPTIAEVRELTHGEIGELMVRGPVVTERYVTRTDQNALHKVTDGDTFWHRMGDVGYLDDRDRFWCCGRKSHRIQTQDGDLFTEPCEAIFNTHEHVYRTALVGAKREQETPVLFIETWPEHRPSDKTKEEQLIAELREIGRGNPLTASIDHFNVFSQLPTDIRHNSKIFREKLRGLAISHISRQGQP